MAGVANLKSEEEPLGEKLLEDMEEVRRIVSLGLEARAKANIKSETAARFAQNKI